MLSLALTGSCSSFPTCIDPNIDTVKDTIPPQLPPLPPTVTSTYAAGLPPPPTIAATDNDPAFNTCALFTHLHCVLLALRYASAPF